MLDTSLHVHTAPYRMCYIISSDRRLNRDWTVDICENKMMSSTCLIDLFLHSCLFDFQRFKYEKNRILILILFVIMIQPTLMFTLMMKGETCPGLNARHYSLCQSKQSLLENTLTRHAVICIILIIWGKPTQVSIIMLTFSEDCVVVYRLLFFTGLLAVVNLLVIHLSTWTPCGFAGTFTKPSEKCLHNLDLPTLGDRLVYNLNYHQLKKHKIVSCNLCFWLFKRVASNLSCKKNTDVSHTMNCYDAYVGISLTMKRSYSMFHIFTL